MDKSAYSEDPYEDGTVPADADFATSSDDGAAPEEGNLQDADEHGEQLIGATGDQEPDPDALVEGNRVATAEDME